MGLSKARKTVVVTGAAGFVGSHLVDRLLAEGFEVIGVDNLMTGDLRNLQSASKDPRFHFQVADVRNGISVYAGTVYNLACPASPPHYQSDPHATLLTSVVGVAKLVEVARERPMRIVHASTSEVYGDPLVHPQTEDYWGNVNPIGERACYDEGKRAAEALLMDAHRTFGADVRILRIFNTYGPRMAFDDGRVISNFLVQALTGRELTIYGDGSQTRSFCYVSDLVEGFFQAGTRSEVPSPINVGNPGEFTMLELAELTREVTGQAVAVRHMPLPADDPRRRRPDIERARKHLGFEPRVPLRRGLELTARDFKDRLGSSEPVAQNGAKATSNAPLA